MKEKQQCNTCFNRWYAFEFFLKHEALQTYEQYLDAALLDGVGFCILRNSCA